MTIATAIVMSIIFICLSCIYIFKVDKPGPDGITLLGIGCLSFAYIALLEGLP